MGPVLTLVKGGADESSEPVVTGDPPPRPTRQPDQPEPSWWARHWENAAKLGALVVALATIFGLYNSLTNKLERFDEWRSGIDRRLDRLEDRLGDVNARLRDAEKALPASGRDRRPSADSGVSGAAVRLPSPTDCELAHDRAASACEMAEHACARAQAGDAAVDDERSCRSGARLCEDARRAERERCPDGG